MKKYIALLLCVVIMTSLIACNSEREQDSEPTQSSETADESVLVENELAMQMYEDVIHGEICMVDEHLGEIKLQEYRFSNSGVGLDECKWLRRAVLDVDRDGINETVIKADGNDHILLRCMDGTVYSYGLDRYEYYKFNTDGTFYWYDSSEESAWECGLNEIVFEGDRLKERAVYGLAYFNDPSSYEYYVGGVAVTGSEYHATRAEAVRYGEVKFSYLDLTRQYPVTARQAWELANVYWDRQDGSREVSAGTAFTARIVLTDVPNADRNAYCFEFQVEWSSNGGGESDECMPPYDVQVHDRILVNAVTGEITTLAREAADGRCISVEDAIETVKNYNEENSNEEDRYRYEWDAHDPAPEHIYVIAVYRIFDDCTVYSVRKWVDKYTGEIVDLYYVFGGKG